MRSVLASSVLLLSLAASAGELPSSHGPPRAVACDQQGQGFIALPGSTTCIRIGGSVAADYVIAGSKAKPAGGGGADWTSARAGMIATGTLNVDARTPTGLGPVRTFIRMRMQSAGGGLSPQP